MLGARDLIYQDIMFSSEIYALASDELIDKIRKCVQKIGRFVCKRSRCEHVSNLEIYQKLGILPVELITAKQTMAWWSKISRSVDPSFEFLQTEYVKIFATRRKTSFVPTASLTRPLQKLVKSYKIFCTCSNFLSPSVKPPKLQNLSLSQIDRTFRDFIKKSKTYDISLFKNL